MKINCKIESFNEKNLLNHINYSLPIFKENTYDYDSIIEIKSIDSSSDFKGFILGPKSSTNFFLENSK